eukprot:TRINITY_DN8411_c0_g1_i2.p1 TRINITY_DN8411_c0_g1~~TRINITY_DN8411_c0_g1_i2.p1  ORF type:complete len:186 (-),score=46.32 TRINITY_DN8411_c0_g1_i2:94-651(-)
MGFPFDVLRYLSAKGLVCSEIGHKSVDHDDTEEICRHDVRQSNLGLPKRSASVRPSGDFGLARRLDAFAEEEEEEVSSPSQKTRIFVKTPKALVPVDVNLAWTGSMVTQTVKDISDLVDLNWNLSSLRFRGKVLSSHQTLKECGIELGSVLHLGLTLTGSQKPATPQKARCRPSLRERAAKLVPI